MRSIDNIHVVPVLAPVDINDTATTTDVVGLKEYHAVKFLVSIGNLAANLTITVNKCDDNTPTNSTAIAFKYRKSAAVGTDTMGSWASEDTDGLDLLAASDDDKMVEILVDGAELTAVSTSERPYVTVTLTPAGAGAALVGVVAVLEPRYQQAVPPSAVD